MTQAYNISQLANNLNSSGQLDATDGLVNAVPVANGGTGASSVSAAVSNLSASIWPVGSIYINAAVTTLLGIGTWVAFGSGRVLVGLNTGDSAFDTLQETGGSKDAILVSHSHSFSGSADTASLTGTFQAGKPPFASGIVSQVSTTVFGSGTGAQSSGSEYNINATHSHSVSGSIGANGSSPTNANLQPYITVQMWLRTA